MKKRRAIELVCLLLTGFFFSSNNLFSAPPEAPQEPAVNYLFRDTFYAAPPLKLKYDVYESAGFLLVRESKRGANAELAVVTGFEDPILESRVLKNIRKIDDASRFLEKNTRKIFFERVPIRELPLIAKDGTPAPRYWIGQRANP